VGRGPSLFSRHRGDLRARVGFSSPCVHQRPASSGPELSSRLRLDKAQQPDGEEQQRAALQGAGQVNPSPAVAQAPSGWLRSRLAREMCALELCGAGLHTPEGLTPTPEVDTKHILRRQKAACGRRAGGAEAPAVGQGGGWEGRARPPAPSSSWHRSHPQTKASGVLRNLVIRQLFLVWLCY